MNKLKENVEEFILRNENIVLSISAFGLDENDDLLEYIQQCGDIDSLLVNVEKLKRNLEERCGKELGMKYTTLTSRLARRYGFRTDEGVIITEITRYSEADRRGLLAGDIILEANRRRVSEASDLENILLLHQN